tara:strand:+ start:336 stop:497 length:162 start_codon:yes stop_codon:yes gene_type:complete
MANLSEEIQRILINLEDARDEMDWDMVSNTINELERIYDDLDRQENGFEFEYE